ncbi:uncharacterized protein LOC122043627 [Zingiber officinale]|uniref:uncharacterized protein LOC122043627 n=1 Tax=Zingiber officinale TaxID=94328 RepID=UPI001C4B3A0C|nr:uncharacterized protein LOC122043627 [Zingiber officinale]
MNKSLDEAKEIIENVAQNHHQWTFERSSGSFTGNPIKVSGKFDVDAVTLMSAKLDALTKKFDAMGGNTAAQMNQLEQCDAITSYNQRQNNLIEKMLEEALSEQKEMRNEIKQLTQRLENSKKHQKMQDSQIAQIAQDGEEATKKIEETLQAAPQNQTIPFPQKFIASQKDKEFNRFLKKIKEICIEVPLIDALHQMSKFVKFLKGILSNRRQKGNFKTVTLTENCSALLMTNSPPKLQDPGSFSIPCKIGSELIPRAFCNLGANVSLLPYTLCKKLDL